MKKIPYIATIATLMILCSLIAPGKTAAQTKADWMPDEGFWQVVSSPADKQASDHQPNDKQPNEKQTVLVQFFGFHEQLIYEERLDAREFNAHKRKTRLLLNECLRTALAASASHKDVSLDQGWVSARMKQQK